MFNPEFLDVAFVLELHEESIARHGGDSGILNVGSLDAAVAMAKHAFGGSYVHATLGAMAAAYLFHICKNHPFADGNKRTAASAAVAFLRGNLDDVPVTDSELADVTIAVADGSMSKAELTAWFEQKLT